MPARCAPKVLKWAFMCMNLQQCRINPCRAPASTHAKMIYGYRTDDELWQELGVLRRRVQEQAEQIERQEAIILSLSQSQSQQSHQAGGQEAVLAQQLRLAEVEISRWGAGTYI